MPKKPINPAEKKRRGTFRPDRLPPKKVTDIVEPLKEVPEPSAWLGAEAVKIFQVVSAELISRRQLDRAGLPLLELYCHSISSAVTLEKRVSVPGMKIEDIKRLQAISRGYTEQARKLAVEFGITPLSAGKVTVKSDNEEKPPNPFDII